MQENSSSVVPHLQIGFLIGSQLVTPTDGVLERWQIEEAVAERDSIEFRVITLSVTKCFHSSGAAANRMGSARTDDWGSSVWHRHKCFWGSLEVDPNLLSLRRTCKAREFLIR